MRLRATSTLAAAAATIALVPATPAGAQRICVTGTQSIGTVCTDQVAPYALSRADCVAAAPAQAAGCLPNVTRLP
jgi:hypothetical protein